MKRYRCGQSLYYYDEASNSIKYYVINSISKTVGSKVYWIFQDSADSINSVISRGWPAIAFDYSAHICKLPDRLYFKSYNKAYKYYENIIHYNELKTIANDLRHQFANIEIKYCEKLKCDSSYTLKLSDGKIKTDLYIDNFGSVIEKLDALDQEVASLKAKAEAKNKKRRSSSCKKESAENKAEQAEDKADQTEDKKDNEHEDMPRVSK